MVKPNLVPLNTFQLRNQVHMIENINFIICHSPVHIKNGDKKRLKWGRNFSHLKWERIHSPGSPFWFWWFLISSIHTWFLVFERLVIGHMQFGIKSWELRWRPMIPKISTPLSMLLWSNPSFCQFEIYCFWIMHQQVPTGILLPCQIGCDEVGLKWF